MYTKINSLTKAPATTNAIIIPVFKDKKITKSDSQTTAALNRPEFTASLGQTTIADPAKTNGPRTVLLGLGAATKFNSDNARIAGAKLVSALHAMGAATATLTLTDAVKKALNPAVFTRAIGEGLGLAAFRFDDFKGTVANKNSKGPKSLKVFVATKTAAQQLKLGLELADAANYARRIAATPPNVATTTKIAAEARKLAAANPRIKCNVYKGADLKKHKLVGLENVGKASEHPPCLIEFIYTPTGKKSKDTLMVVGKTIAYDTGGLSLKVGNGMKGMKYDKCGGMAVLGFIKALAALKPNCRIVALMPTAENSVSNNAYRPDDILTYANGVTVEVTNTDAEGRLVLADALAWGEKKHKPAAIVDLATLTGGVVVALGSVYAGLWCEDDKLRNQLDNASAQSGERLWRLPHHQDYNDMMKASHADIHNSAPVRAAHPIQGAAFLSYFVNDQTPWAHIDIAGTADLDKANALFPAGPTGFGVRLLANLVENWK